MSEILKEIKRGQTGHGLLIENDGYIDIDSNEAKSVLKEDREGVDKEFFCPYPFILPAVFQRFDAENANGRIYPESILKREVDKYQERIKERRATAELNHPSESVIDLSRVAINVVELHWENKTLVGKIEILTSPGFRKYGIISCCGDETANLILNGIKIGLSSRAVGSVEQKMGKMIVGPDLELICFDVVSDPSTKNAWICDADKPIPKQYIESKESKPLLEQLSQFNEWLSI